MKNKIFNKTYQVILHSIAWTDKKRKVLYIINHKNNTRTTYDNVRGKQVWHTPHNVPVIIKIPDGCIEIPNHVEKIKQIFGIK